MGTFAVQIAKALGAHVSAATSTRNLELIRSIAPDEVIEFEVFFDIAANRSLAECRRVLEPNGILVGAGATKGNSLSVLTRLLTTLVLSRFVSQRLVPFMAKVCHDDLVVLKQLIEAGKLRPVIDRTYSLSEVPDAVRYVGSGQARAKVVIHVS